MTNRAKRVILSIMLGTLLLTGVVFAEEAYYVDATTTINGVLQAADEENGTILITSETDEALILKVTEDSQIISSETLIEFSQLTDIISSVVEVEFESETSNVIRIQIKE